MPKKKETKKDDSAWIDDIGKLVKIAKGFSKPSRVLAYELGVGIGDSIKLDNNESVLNSHFDETKGCWLVLVKREIE